MREKIKNVKQKSKKKARKEKKKDCRK